MDGRILTAMLAVLMMVGASVAVQGTEFSGLSCLDEDQGGNASIYCKTAVGPASFTHKSIVGIGVAACQDDDDPVTPLPCDPETGTTIPSAGGAIFLNDFAEAPTQDIRFELWVGDSNVICPPGPAVVLCGFDVLLCNDRDINTDLVNGGTCTNVNDDSDQLRSTQSNEPLIGEACPPENKDKDEKNCGVDDLDAYIQACFMPKEGKNDADGHWAPGQIVAFIGAWVSSWPGGAGAPLNIGAGVSAGTYEIWLREGPGCIVPACDDRGDNDGDGGVDYPIDPQCMDEDDASEEGNGSQEPDEEPTPCKMVRTVVPIIVPPFIFVVIDRVRVTNCGPQCGGPAGFTTPNEISRVKDIFCTAFEACDGHDVMATATIASTDPGASVWARIYCDFGVPFNIISDAFADSSFPEDIGPKNPKEPLFSHWRCAVRFDAGPTYPFLPYVGEGTCEDP